MSAFKVSILSFFIQFARLETFGASFNQRASVLPISDFCLDINVYYFISIVWHIVRGIKIAEMLHVFDLKSSTWLHILQSAFIFWYDSLSLIRFVMKEVYC